MNMSNRTYDILRWIACIVLPAVVTFVAAIGKIWGIPYTPQVAATIAAVDTLLGACLQISSANYIEKKFDDEADDDDYREDIEVRG